MSQQGRRTALKILVGTGSALVAALLTVPGVGYVLDPLLRRRSREDEFKEIGEASILRDDRPVSVTVIGEKRDAWTRAPNQRLGSVWLQKKGDGSVLALSAECPHLGCRVSYQEEENRFFCPCHDAAFDLEGNVTEGPAKRGMDPLEARVREGLVELKFKRFRTNIEEQVEVG